MSKTIGILGGMGPLATVDLFQKLVVLTSATTDQEHLRILIYNNPKIPPRNFISTPDTPSPLPELIQSAKKLEQAGADFIIMPCHTAHLWLEDILEAISIPFYSLIENTVRTMIRHCNDSNRKVLLLATQATIEHRLYQHAFSSSPFEIVTPSVEEQKVVDRSISCIKAGYVSTNPHLQDLIRIIERYQDTEVSIVLGGCSEIPLLFPYFNLEIAMLDPTMMLAMMAIQKAS